MQELLQKGHISKMKLQSINRVRCHLQVLSLADIVTGDGKNIGNNYIEKRNLLIVNLNINF